MWLFNEGVITQTTMAPWPIKPFSGVLMPDGLMMKIMRWVIGLLLERKVLQAITTMPCIKPILIRLQPAGMRSELLG